MNPAHMSMQMSVKLESVSDLAHARFQTGILLYYSDDQGESFRKEAAAWDPQLAPRLEREKALGALAGATEESAWFQTEDRTYLIVSLGPSSRRDRTAIRVAVERAMRDAYGRKSSELAICFAGLTKPEAWIAAEAAVTGSYRYQTTKSRKAPVEQRTVQMVGTQLNSAELEQAAAIARGTMLARELSILPANYGYPRAVVQIFKDWAKGLPLEIIAYGRQECQELGMGSFLSVASGTEKEPQMLLIKYTPDKTRSKEVLGLVGKGVTFDTGGYNLKVVPYKDLIDMKADMGGAAAVCGAMITLATLKPEVPVVAVCGFTENMISSTATHPGDVVTAMDGTTIEVQNTDAEGRLVLADALLLAKREGATKLVDVATLTGACAVALGKYYTGLMTNDPSWSARVSEICNSNGEPVWPLPIHYRYRDELKSDVADISNMGKAREGGAMLAAEFLHHFAGDTPWVHLDIAGTGDIFGTGATGLHGTAKYSGVMASSLVHIARALE